MTTDPYSSLVPWSDVPTVFVVRARCPHCGGLEFGKPVRCEANGDGSVTRKQECKECGQRFKLVVELPPSGNETVWPCDT